VKASPVVPKHYSLTLTPDFEKKTVEGNESITVHLSERTSTFDLNVVDLTVGSAVIRDGRSTQTATISLDKGK
jgi:hypothetical protein